MKTVTILPVNAHVRRFSIFEIWLKTIVYDCKWLTYETKTLSKKRAADNGISLLIQKQSPEVCLVCIANQN